MRSGVGGAGAGGLWTRERPTDLERSPAMADLEDWIVLDDGRSIGRIYEKHAAVSPDQAWFWWSITAGEGCDERRAPTIDQAKQDFLKSWSAWTAWLSR